MGKFLPEQQHLYCNKHPLVKYAVNARIKALLNKISSNDSVLEAGSGEGYITLLIAKKAARVVGIDIDKRFIASSKKRLAKAKITNTEIIHGDILTFSSKIKFDKIICSEVLEHLENPAPAIENLAKLLKPEGNLIITIPNEKVLNVARKLAFPKNWRTIKQNTGHKIELNSRLISKLASDLKLRTVAVERIPIPFPYLNELIVLKK